MPRNLISRMGLASGVTAALVAAVFAVLVTAVRDQRDAGQQARRSEQIGAAAVQVRLALAQVDLGARGEIDAAPDVRSARSRLPRLLVRLEDLVAGDARQRARVRRLEGRTARYLADTDSVPADLLQRSIDEVLAVEHARADDRREEADRLAGKAVALGIGGLVGSAVLIALLTTYLTRYIVIPLRRTVRAAHRVAHGDLTARVAEEGDAEPVQLAGAFNQMAESLQESERIKDEFFALVSHELRTPLTSIIGYLELVLDDEKDLSPDARRFLEVVDRNAKRLLRLVGDMLFVAQVEAGRLPLEREPVSLTRVAAEAIEAARPAAARGRVALELDAGPVGEVVGDRDRFGQMLDNLVSNAVKFTHQGGSVTLRVRDAGDSAVVEVVDDGVGISDADQRHLFERFFRTASATSGAVPGAGLGLTIVKTIAEAHGGRIAVTSREGVGTTVRIALPYRDTGNTGPDAAA